MFKLVILTCSFKQKIKSLTELDEQSALDYMTWLLLLHLWYKTHGINLHPKKENLQTELLNFYSKVYSVNNSPEFLLLSTQSKLHYFFHFGLAYHTMFWRNFFVSNFLCIFSLFLTNRMTENASWIFVHLRNVSLLQMNKD